jgi:tetraacyldisaccharide 4'-kinase
MNIKLLSGLEKVWKSYSYGHKNIIWMMFLCYPLMFFYRCASFLKRCFFACPLFYTKTANPLIIIGNITVGGSGKTPMTMKCAEYLQSKGEKIHFISRGYGSVFRGSFAFYEGGKWDREGFFGDEVEMFAERFSDLTVSVGKRRALLVKKISLHDSQKVILMDDALQYWRLKSDFNIVMIHGSLLFGNNHIFPLGPLREKPFSALKRAGLVVVYNPVREPDFYRNFLVDFNYRGELFFATSNIACFYRLCDGQELKSTDIYGKKIVLVSGIAHPDYFEENFQEFGCELLKHFRFPDHHHFSAAECHGMLEFADNEEADWLCITEKDKMRWAGSEMSNKIIYTGQNISISNEDEFFRLINNYIYSKRKRN